MITRQGKRNVTLTPQGYSQGNRLVLSGAEIHEMGGRYIGFWHVGDMNRDLKRELLVELAAHWMPPNYDSEALR